MDKTNQLTELNFFSVFRSGSCGGRRRPPAPGSAVEVEVPTTRISVWPAPPPPRGTTWVQTRTSSPARCLPTPFTPPCPASVTRLPASTVRAAQTARQRSEWGHTRTHSSCTAAWCAPKRWITETWRRCEELWWISFNLKRRWNSTGLDSCSCKQELYYPIQSSHSAFPVFTF